jgi:hypothetical protein
MPTNIGSTPPPVPIGGLYGGVMTPVPVGVYGETSLVDGFRCKQGDTAITLQDSLSYSNGTIADLTDATVMLVMRSLADLAPINLSGTVTVSDPTSGVVDYQLSGSDTSEAGNFTACWVVTFSSGVVMTFPSVGYIDVEIEPVIGSEQQLLVDLEAVKRYPGMSIPANDRHVDARLIDFIQAIQPLIEQQTGPILPQTFVEKYPGGNNVISLSHRPAVGYGTTPILNLLACSEFIGPTEYPLTLVGNVALGSIYSYEVNVRLGTLVRRTSGGGSIAFPAGPNSVLVTYQAGQSVVPANVRLAVLETIRSLWQTTQPVGRGRQTVADALESASTPGWALPPNAQKWLKPTRRGPSIA